MNMNSIYSPWAYNHNSLVLHCDGLQLLGTLTMVCDILRAELVIYETTSFNIGTSTISIVSRLALSTHLDSYSFQWIDEEVQCAVS